MTFTLKPEEAYGEVSDAYIPELEKDLFKNEEGEFHSDVVFAAIRSMLDNQGNQLVGIVEKITDDKVILDFNHPLAGQTLHFIGSVLEARPATEEDRQRRPTAQFSGQVGGCCDGDDHEGGCSAAAVATATITMNSRTKSATDHLFGESHGAAFGGILDGMPAGFLG